MAYKAIKRDVYRRSLNAIAADYLDRGGLQVYLTFIDRVGQCAEFIAELPYACAVHTILRDKEFRRWGVKGFPVSVFFSIEEPDTVYLEAVYAHRMNIGRRMEGDLG